MRAIIGLFLLIFTIGFNIGYSQQIVKLEPDTFKVVETLEDHSPQKAAKFSAILPGLGQIYNKKYWKLPLVYGGLGASIYYYIDNRSWYKKLRYAYLYSIDDDPLNDDPDYGHLPSSELKLFRDDFRKKMENGVIFTAAVYFLNIIDATVDAHLYSFDVSDDLSLNWSPMIYNNGFDNSIGARINLKF